MVREVYIIHTEGSRVDDDMYPPVGFVLNKNEAEVIREKLQSMADEKLKVAEEAWSKGIPVEYEEEVYVITPISEIAWGG